jgi:hypothetical protein
MGRVSCTLDPHVAAERDAALRGAGAPPPLALPPLGDGTVAAGRPLAGSRAVQGTVRLGGGEGRLDDVVGKGFTLISRRAADLAAPPPGPLVVLDQLDDLDGRLTAWFDEHRLEAVLVRPDGYVFGAVEALADLPGLLDELYAHLFTTDSRITTHVH